MADDASAISAENNAPASIENRNGEAVPEEEGRRPKRERKQVERIRSSDLRKAQNTAQSNRKSGTPPSKKKTGRAKPKQDNDDDDDDDDDEDDIDEPLSGGKQRKKKSPSKTKRPARPTDEADSDEDDLDIPLAKRLNMGSEEKGSSPQKKPPEGGEPQTGTVDNPQPGVANQPDKLRKMLQEWLGSLSQDDLDNLSLKSVRRKLEEKSGLQTGELDPHKGMINTWVDEMLVELEERHVAEARRREEEARRADQARKKKADAAKRAEAKKEAAKLEEERKAAKKEEDRRKEAKKAKREAEERKSKKESEERKDREERRKEEKEKEKEKRARDDGEHHERASPDKKSKPDKPDGPRKDKHRSRDADDKRSSGDRHSDSGDDASAEESPPGLERAPSSLLTRRPSFSAGRAGSQPPAIKVGQAHRRGGSGGVERKASEANRYRASAEEDQRELEALAAMGKIAHDIFGDEDETIEDLQRKEEVKQVHVEVLGREPPADVLAQHLEQLTADTKTIDQLRAELAATPEGLARAEEKRAAERERRELEERQRKAQAELEAAAAAAAARRKAEAERRAQERHLPNFKIPKKQPPPAEEARKEEEEEERGGEAEPGKDETKVAETAGAGRESEAEGGGSRAEAVGQYHREEVKGALQLTPNSRSLRAQYAGARHVGDILQQWGVLSDEQVEQCWQGCGMVADRFCELALAKYSAEGVSKEILERAERRLREVQQAKPRHLS